MNAEKMRRLREAAVSYEEPLCRSLTNRGVPAHRNTNIATQRTQGDVLFTMTDGSRRSFEVQVSKKHTSFSYTAHKVLEYVGPGEPEHAYVMLACLQSKQDPTGMLFFMCSAKELHRYLKDNEVRCLSDDGRYYVISPGDVIAFDGPVAFGDSIEEVVQEFLTSGKL